MKRLLAIALTLVLAVGLIAVPAFAAEEPIKAEISIQVEEGWVSYYDAAIARVMEKNPDAKIEKKVIGSFDHFEILTQTDATNPDFADVFALPADRLAGLHKNDVLAALDSKKIAEALGGFEDFDAGLGGNFKIDDEYFSFPMNIETLILFGNKANIEKAKLDTAKPVELKGNEEAILLPLFDAWFGVAATNSAGIELLGKDDNGELFSDLTADWKDLAPEKQAVIEALFDYWKFNHDKGTSLFDADAGWGYIDDQFKPEGNAGLRLGGPWETSSNTDLAGKDNVEVFPISTVTIAGKPLSHWKGGWGLGINARIEEDEAKYALAEALIIELLRPENAVEFFKTTGKLMENVKVETYLDSDLPDTDKAVIEAVFASYKDAPARPLFEEWGKVWDSWKNAVLSWNNVKPADAEAAYKELQASFKAMMDSF